MSQTKAQLIEGSSSQTITASSATIGAGSAGSPSITTTGDTNTGILFPAADTVAISTSGTERARLDSSGRLLVGTSTSPSAGNGQYARLVVTGNTNALGAGVFNIQTTVASASVAPDNDLGFIQFTGNDGNVFAWIRAQCDGTAGPNDYPGRLVFSTTADGASSPTERMKIDSAGTTTLSNPNSSRTAPHILLVDTGDNRTASLWNNAGIMSLGGSGASNTTSININHGDTYIEYTGAQYFSGVGTTASAANAFLNSGSSPANQLLRSTSSLRYKTDIEDLEQDRSDSILNFRPVWYRSTAEADRSDWSWYGLIAEEVAEIEPRLVHWTYLEDAYEEVEGKRQLKPDAEMVPDGVQYDRLTVLLLDVVQRQHKAIGILEAKVAALESA